MALIASIASLGKNPCNDAKLKIIPANQSLILAGEPTGSLSGTAAPSHYLSPTQLYARTQRGLAPKSALLDVLA